MAIPGSSPRPEAAQRQFQAGVHFLQNGDAAAAADAWFRAAETCPEDREILSLLADAFVRVGNWLPALQTYNRLIALGDVTAQSWCAAGRVLTEVGEYAQAIRTFEKAIECESGYAEAHHHLGQALFKLGDIDRAMTHLEIAEKESGHLLSSLALATLVPGAPAADATKILAVRRRFAERLAKVCPSSRETAGHADPIVSRRPDQRIRVGYLSAFFARANYMKPVWALINHHDRSRFQIHLFSDTPEQEGMEGYESCPDDRIHEVAGFRNDALAECIRAEKLDILVDLNAYSAPERLALFLSPPAPVCVAWFNMYATSGLPGFDYIVGDDEVVSEDEACHYSEQIVRLPVSYLTFTVNHRAPPVADPPCLSNKAFTFGSLVAQYKINSEVISTWAEILDKAANSRLLIANRAMDSVENRNWLTRRFVELGVKPKRLIVLGSAEHYQYLQYYDRIDVALDAFPYNGGTTTMEAIWQGVPVFTFRGDRWASRTSQTLLRRTHLAGFVAENRAGMVRAAVSLANDLRSPEQLHRLRSEMRTELRRTPACDARALARSMERFYFSRSLG